MIVAQTHIGYGQPEQGRYRRAHGAPLGADEVAATQARTWAGLPSRHFFVPEEVSALYAARARRRCRPSTPVGSERLAAWRQANPSAPPSWTARQALALPDDLEEQLLAALPAKTNATRRLSGEVIQQAAELVPYLVGGSADLAPSTSTLTWTPMATSRRPVLAGAISTLACASMAWVRC